MGTQKHCNNFFRSQSVKSGAQDLASDAIRRNLILLTCKTIVSFLQIARTHCIVKYAHDSHAMFWSRTQRFPSFSVLH